MLCECHLGKKETVLPEYSQLRKATCFFKNIIRFYYFLKYLLIYLAVLGLGCGMIDL